MSKILEFKKDIPIKFAVRSKNIEFGQKKNGDISRKQIAVIVLKNDKNGKEIIHFLTDFILYRWSTRSYNTMRNHAKNIVSFLNYILKNNDKLKIYSLSELDFIHGTEYLNHLTIEGKKRITVKSAERSLTEFYLFLSKRKIINIDVEKFEMKPHDYYKNTSYYTSPFIGVIMPRQKKTQMLHKIPFIYILRFLEIAVREANPIALGVYMQIFGGIRIGEIVNITRSSIFPLDPYCMEGLMVDLNYQGLRYDLKDSSGANHVKKPREQLVLGFRDWLKTLYTEHTKNYTSYTTDALFINRDGKAMSGQSYRYHFSKVKQHFINDLLSSSNPTDRTTAMKLISSKWSTHIGRGIFTNLIAENASNLQEIVLMRGDSNYESSLTYLANTERMKKKLEDYLDGLYGKEIPKL